MPLPVLLHSIAEFRSSKSWQPRFCGTTTRVASAAVLLGFLAEDQLCVVAAGLSYWSWSNWGHCWSRDLNSERHEAAWAHASSACLGNKFTPLLHAQQKTVFANCIRERQHQVFQPQKNLGCGITWGECGQHSGPQTFMVIFHTSWCYLCLQKIKAFHVILVMTGEVRLEVIEQL